MLVLVVLGLFGSAGLGLFWTSLPSVPVLSSGPVEFLGRQQPMVATLGLERLATQLRAGTVLGPVRPAVPASLAPQLTVQRRSVTKLVSEPVRPGPVRPEPVRPEPVPAPVFQSAVKIFAPSPEYPDAARQKNLSGNVVVEASIDIDGAVNSTRVVRGVAPELDRAAQDSVSRWRFEPARRGAEPVPDTYRVSVRFALAPRAEPEPAVAPKLAETPAVTDADLRPPTRLFAPSPSYPQSEWVAAVEGDVVLRAAIDIHGKVSNIEVLEGLSPGLDQAAIEALEKWRFRPATRQGQAVAAHQVLRFRFAR